MEDKYIVLIASLEELLKDKDEVLLTNFDTRFLTSKMNQIEK